MKLPVVIPILSLVCLAIVIAGCTSTSPANPAVPPSAYPSLTVQPAASACGFTTCHGLDLSCGTNAPQVCTMEYQIGDKCRQFAYCDSSGGTCRVVKSPQFASCRDCVRKCTGADATEIASCEEKR